MAAQPTFKSLKSLVPLLDPVLVQRFKQDCVFLSQSSTTTPLPEATVIATGPGAPDKEGKIVPTSVQAGDRVLLPGLAIRLKLVNRNTYFLFRDSEILAKITK